jgi:hypothetical protein
MISLERESVMKDYCSPGSRDPGLVLRGACFVHRLHSGRLP